MNIKQIKNKTDAWTGLGIIVFIIIVYLQTVDLEPAIKLLPRVVMAIGLLMGIGIFVRSFISENTKVNKKEIKDLKLLVIKAALLLFIGGMLLLVKTIGMYTCIFLVISAITLTITCIEHGFVRKKILFMVFYNLMVTALVVMRLLNAE